MSVAAVIQARMGSSRLPGKSMMRLGNHAVLDWVTIRVGRATAVDTVIVATSTNPEDDPIADHVASRGDIIHRGHPTDVLDRFAGAIELTDADTVVRITADCPLLDPGLIDFGIELYRRTEARYVATGLDGRMPHGVDLEVIDRKALSTAAAHATDPIEREHVTPYVVRRPELFPATPLVAPVWARHPELRFTLDERSDFDLISRVVDELGAAPETLQTREVVELLTSRSDLTDINRDVAHRNVT